MSNIELIKQMVKNAESVKLSPELQAFSDELKAEQMAEQLVVEHGILEASKDEVKQEFESLDAVEREESDDFDNDENLVDMDIVSGAMRDACDA